MPITDNIVGDIEAVERKPYFVPRPDPAPIPEPNIFDEPLVCLIVNEKWAAHIRGVMDAMDQPDTWIGTDEEIEAARQQVREALVRFGQACMICCDDELALLEEIKVLNQSIVNNQLTMIENNLTVINNQETVINQNTEEILNGYTNTYNNWVTTNQNTAIYNQQLYDGTPQSISSNLGTNFDDTSEAALCAAIKRYIENDIANYTAMLNLASFAAGAIAGAAAAIAIALTAGAAAPVIGAWGMILGTASGASVAAWNAAAGSPEAKRKVACCMFESLNGEAITQAAFAASVGDCEFDPTTAEGRVSGRINDVNQSQENYLAFLRMLGQEIGGSAGECACDCDNAAEIVSTGVYGNVVTNMGNCIWRSTQLTPVYEEPAIDVARYYHEWKDLLDRCILVEEVPFGSEYDTQPTSDYFQIDCDDDEQTGVGGGGGEVKKMGFRMGPSPQYYKITLVE